MDNLETFFRTAIIHPRKYTHSTCNTGHPVRTNLWYGTVHCGETTAWPCIVWLQRPATIGLAQSERWHRPAESLSPVESPLLYERILFLSLVVSALARSTYHVIRISHPHFQFQSIFRFTHNKPRSNTTWPESNNVSAALQLLERNRNRTGNGNGHCNGIWEYDNIPVHVRDGEHPV